MSSQPIEEIRKQFHHEWLLIAIDEMDEKNTIPISGRLLTHSPSRNEIYKASYQYEGHLMTLYSEDWPEDLAAAF